MKEYWLNIYNHVQHPCTFWHSSRDFAVRGVDRSRRLLYRIRVRVKQ